MKYDDSGHPLRQIGSGLAVHFIEGIGGPRERLEKLSRQLRESARESRQTLTAIDPRLAEYFAEQIESFLTGKYGSLEQAFGLNSGQGNKPSAKVEKRDRKIAKSLYKYWKPGQTWERTLELAVENEAVSDDLGESTARRAFKKFFPELIAADIAANVAKKWKRQ